MRKVVTSCDVCKKTPLENVCHLELFASRERSLGGYENYYDLYEICTYCAPTLEEFLGVGRFTVASAVTSLSVTPRYMRVDIPAVHKLRAALEKAQSLDELCTILGIQG